MKRIWSFAVVCACVVTAVPSHAHSQAANDAILREEAVERTQDELVAGVVSGVEGVAKDSARALVAEARRDVDSAESAMDLQRIPTPVADSDQAIEQEIDKLESASQE